MSKTGGVKAGRRPLFSLMGRAGRDKNKNIWVTGMDFLLVSIFPRLRQAINDSRYDVPGGVGTGITAGFHDQPAAATFVGDRFD